MSLSGSKKRREREMMDRKATEIEGKMQQKNMRDKLSKKTEKL